MHAVDFYGRVIGIVKLKLQLANTDVCEVNNIWIWPRVGNREGYSMYTYTHCAILVLSILKSSIVGLLRKRCLPRGLLTGRSRVLAYRPDTA